MFSVLVLGFAVFDVIFLRIELVIALSYKNVTTNVIVCEHKDALLIWEYQLQPGDYVKAKTWFTGVSKTARRIAYWKDTDGLTIESEFRDRVTTKGNDSLLLRDVTTRDEGLYTLIPSFPLSSDPDPKLTLNLTVYISPLKEAGCCKPDINASHIGLHAFLHSAQACGKPSPILNWTIARNKEIMNDTLILGSDDKGGTYKVCVSGPAVDKCFDGEKDILCKSYTVPIERQICLDENLRSVELLTSSLIDIYNQRPQFKEADSNLKLKIKVLSGSSPEQHIDLNLYTNVLCEDEVPLKRILIIGEVGCGKKTWCNSLTHDWCDAQSKNVPDTERDNIKFLRKFKLLFNLSLKSVQAVKNINQLLPHLRIPIWDALNMDISEHLSRHKAIFVIQGLEEYSGSPEDINQILSDEHLQQSLIIVTSRPTVWDNKYKDILSFDRIISVQGLDQEEMKKRAQRILERRGFPQKVIDNFFFSIKERGLEEFMTEPIFFPSLVTMWQANCSLPCNSAEFLLNVIENKIKKKGPSLEPKTSKYRSDLSNSLVFTNKEFTLHYGKIMQGIGEIAFNILSINNESCTFDEKHFDTVFKSQGCYDEKSQTFMKHFCVCIDLVSKEDGGNIQTFSFRHIMLQTFLAAIYVSTLGKEQRIDAAEKLKSLNKFSDFLKCINPQQ